MTAKEHYDFLLGEVYSWMVGDFEHQMQQQKEFFARNNIRPEQNRIAFDLGAGHGLQSIALAELGFQVRAVDFNSTLLEQLLANKRDLPITVTQQDIASFLDNVEEKAGLIVCMGDTLTHLHDNAELRRVMRNIADVLSEGGKAIFSWRDLSESRHGIDRFIHVRSDETRSMTCFLEYLTDHVMVHDIVTEKVNGSWSQRVSCYPKLKIPVPSFADILEDSGLIIHKQETTRGMISVVCGKN